MKRAFDIIFAVIILLFFLPIGVFIALLIVLTSGTPIFYSQERVGQYGLPFQLLKFRTMNKNADRSGKLTVGMRDPRITAVGFVLRKFKLDEFPQFINVLRGDMSIVGPRPEVREYTDLYSEKDREILSLKPGITDYASLHFFHENEILGRSSDPQKTYIEEIMPQKLALNHIYKQKASLATDLQIIWKTFLKLFQ